MRLKVALCEQIKSYLTVHIRGRRNRSMGLLVVCGRWQGPGNQNSWHVQKDAKYGKCNSDQIANQEKPVYNARDQLPFFLDVILFLFPQYLLCHHGDAARLFGKASTGQ